MAPSRARPKLAAFLGVLGLLLIFTAVLIGYTRRSLFDERAFGDRIAASLEDPNVAEFAASQLADAVIAAKPDLVGVRPVLIGVSRSVVGSAAFRAAVRRSARILHRSITSGQARDIVLTVKDAGDVLESAMASQPGLAKKIPTKVSAAIGRLQSLPGGERAAALVRLANRVRVMAWGLLVLGVALGAISVWLSGDKRAAIVRLGIGLAGLALVLGIAAKFGGNIAGLSVRHDDLGPVIAGISGAFLSGLWIWAIGLGLTGLVLAAASASLLERVPIRHIGEAAGQWFFAPQAHMSERLARGVFGFGLGAAMLLWPMPALTVVAWIAGLLVAFLGLREAFVAALHLLPAIEPRAQAKGAAGRQTHGRAIAVIGTLAVLLIAGTAWFVLRSPDAPVVPEVVTAYNGSVALGDRTLDQVVFPATHNSMSGADVPGWMFPNQSAGIEEQLKDGIRCFLIDIHYASPAGEYVKTQIDSEASSMAKYEEAVGKEAVAAALRIRNRLTGVETGKVDVYMAHGFAELGAAKFIDALQEMHDFLVANPGEVLVMIIQDEGVEAKDIERCFDESGLIDFVYHGPFQKPWPTLKEMVDSDQRVVVMTERLKDGLPDWIHWAFDVVQETPYTFHNRTQFSNAPNRGGTGGSLYMMNHWIETTPMPKPSNADTVNAHDFLLARIRDFQKRRGHVPNIVAVDFYREGDLIGVVRELNEEPVMPAPALSTKKKGRS